VALFGTKHVTYHVTGPDKHLERDRPVSDYLGSLLVFTKFRLVRFDQVTSNVLCGFYFYCRLLIGRVPPKNG